MSSGAGRCKSLGWSVRTVSFAGMCLFGSLTELRTPIRFRDSGLSSSMHLSVERLVPARDDGRVIAGGS